MSTTPLSGDEEHDFNTGHVPIGQSPEDFPPAIQKNIIEMGSYIVSNLCHPTMINLYLPARPQQEQLYMFMSHLTVKTLWTKLQILTNEPYFSQFVEAVSTYTGILHDIKYSHRNLCQKHYKNIIFHIN